MDKGNPGTDGDEHLTGHYMLDGDLLELADIVLVSDDKMQSRAIRGATNGPFSHAAINVGHSLIEATLKGGVFSKSPQRLFRDRADQFMVLRMRASLDRAQRQAVCEFVRLRVGTLYSVAEAARSLSSNEDGARTRRQFCSRLVAEAYASVGISLVDRPSYCSPNDIFRSPLLESVEGVVRRITDADRALVAGKDQAADHQVSTFAWLKAARTIAARRGVDIQTISDVLEFVILNPDCDESITSAVEATTYLQDHQLDLSCAPYKYDPEAYLTKVSAAGSEVDTVLANELSKELSMVRTAMGNRAQFIAWAPRRLRFVDVHVALYDRLLTMSETRVAIIRDTADKFGLDDGVAVADRILAHIGGLPFPVSTPPPATAP